MRPVILLLGFLFVLPPVQAQTERVLAPFDTMLLESSGARWVAQLWAHNQGTQPFKLPAFWCSGICQDVPPGATVLVDVFQQPNAAHPGVLLTVPENVQFNLRVRDANKGADQVGTELPVVREREWRTGATSLIGVPLMPGTRSSLRIYLIRDEPAEFLVRLFGEPGAGPLLAQESFRYTPAAPLPGDVPPTIEAGSILRGWVADQVRVTIEPRQSGPYYPLLTITNPRNNQITTVTPQ